MIISSDIPEKLDFPPAYTGDLWQPVPSLGPLTISGEYPTFPLVKALMEFRQGCCGTGMTLATDNVEERDFTIVISAAATWLMHLPEVRLPLGPGRWDYTLRLFAEDQPEVPVTWLYGVLPVLSSPSSLLTAH